MPARTCSPSKCEFCNDCLESQLLQERPKILLPEAADASKLESHYSVSTGVPRNPNSTLDYASDDAGNT